MKPKLTLNLEDFASRFSFKSAVPKAVEQKIPVTSTSTSTSTFASSVNNVNSIAEKKEKEKDPIVEKKEKEKDSIVENENVNVTIHVVQNINNYHNKLIYSPITLFTINKDSTILELKKEYMHKRFNMPMLKIHDNVYKNINININGYNNTTKKHTMILSQQYNDNSQLKILNMDEMNIFFSIKNHKSLFSINGTNHLFLFESATNTSTALNFIQLHSGIKSNKLSHNNLPIIINNDSLIVTFNIDINNVNATNNAVMLLDKIADDISPPPHIENAIFAYLYLLKINNNRVTIKKCTNNQYDLIKSYCKDEGVLCSFSINMNAINEVEKKVIAEFNKKYIVDNCIYEGNINEMIKTCCECICQINNDN